MHGTESPERPADAGTGHSTPDTPPSQYRTATATLSAAFASLWGSYQQQQHQQHQQNRQADGQVEGGGNPASSTPSSPRAGGGGRGRPRAAIPFNISSPIEAPTRSTSKPAPIITSPTLKPSALRSAFDRPDDVTAVEPSSATTVTNEPANRDASRSNGLLEPGRQTLLLPPPPTASGSGGGSSSFPSAAGTASAAYSTLSRLRTKPSRTGLNLGGSGFLWGSGGGGAAATAASSSSDAAAQIQAQAQAQRTAANWEETIRKQERLDAHVRRIVFQAGLDYETRPMVVLAACCLPDPKEVDYNALFDRIVSTMDLFAENDYTIIYLASGGTHRPGWNWLWKTYRRLGRKFRKNLKKLYIVHPTFFSRSLMQFVQTGAYFISPKFPKKVTTVYTLTELAQHVPLTQIDIPPAVLQFNATLEPSVRLPEQQGLHGDQAEGGPSRVFGVDLIQLMGEQGERGGVPKVVRDCVEAILGRVGDIAPIEVEGIFRRSPSSALLKAAQESYDRGHPVDLSNYNDPHVPAVLLKVFLRSLPRPVFPVGLYPVIAACPPPPAAMGSDEDDGPALQAAAQETIQHIRDVLLSAIEPQSAVILLSYVVGMLHRVSQHSDVNKMDAANLATVIAPNLVSSGNAVKDMMLCRVEGIRSMSAVPRAALSLPVSPRPGQQQQQQPDDDNKQQQQKKHPATLGSIVRFCIEHYYEVFDEDEFGPRVERAQQLVDEFSTLPASASVLTFHSANDGDSPAASPSTPSSPRRLRDGLPRTSGDGPLHRRYGSTASTTSGLSQPTSPFNLAFTPPRAKLSPPIVQTDSETPSLHQSKSVTSREYRAVGTFGRNSAGSLRLTKRSLMTMNGNGNGSHNGGTSSSRDEDLTGALSGVTITGASASGYFSSPFTSVVAGVASNSNGSPWVRGTGSEGSEAETPSSPISLSPKGSPSLGTSPLAASATSATSNSSEDSLGALVKRRNTDSRNRRRELSEVREDSEA